MKEKHEKIELPLIACIAALTLAVGLFGYLMNAEMRPPGVRHAVAATTPPAEPPALPALPAPQPEIIDVTPAMVLAGEKVLNRRSTNLRCAFISSQIAEDVFNAMMAASPSRVGR